MVPEPWFELLHFLTSTMFLPTKEAIKKILLSCFTLSICIVGTVDMADLGLSSSVLHNKPAASSILDLKLSVIHRIQGCPAFVSALLVLACLYPPFCGL